MKNVKNAHMGQHLLVEVYTRDFGNQTGTYICTLDNFHADVDAVDYSTSEQPAEHKSHNLLELDNGQFCLYPNNRMRIYDNSITPETPKVPDFKVSTVYYQVENGHDPVSYTHLTLPTSDLV